MFRSTNHQRRGLEAFARHIPSGALAVEVGAAYGESAAILLASGRIKHLTCVDRWLPLGDVDNPNERQAAFLKIQAKHSGILDHLKMESVAAAKLFKDQTLDLVYIDASHDFASVCADIRAWLPKIKSGGIIGGHDYRSDVERAVLATLRPPEHTFQDSSWLIAL